MSEAWTTLKVLDWTAGRFERAGVPTSRLDAQVLLAHVLRCPRVALYTDFDKPLAEAELATYRGLIQRRLAGEPVAYLTGHQEFWSLDFVVDPRVLIPRPDTETLVQVALELGDAVGETSGDSGATVSVAEVATGSGAIAVSLAHERKHWKIIATDLSDDAVAMAKGNAERNGVADRIEFRAGDLLGPLKGERFSLVVANLPYISKPDMQSLPVDVQHEPKSALFGGETGVELIDKLVTAVRGNLEPGGWVALEHGFDQGEAVRELAEKAGFTQVQTRSDLADRARVTFFQQV